MNIIEQLGGYEKAKRELQLKEQNSVLQCCIAVTTEMIRDALIEHRRQHNIFESGDLVTSKKWVDGSIHKIELVDSEDRTLKIFSHDMAFSYWVDSRNYRHTTDEEIAAGKRL